jgi:hypothetical protein
MKGRADALYSPKIVLRLKLHLKDLQRRFNLVSNRCDRRKNKTEYYIPIIQVLICENQDRWLF